MIRFNNMNIIKYINDMARFSNMNIIKDELV